MKKIILFMFLLVCNSLFSQQTMKIKAQGTSNLGYEFEYECDLIYKLETTIADGYKNNPSGVRFAVRNLIITDVSYNGIKASSINNINLPKSCGKVSSVTVSGRINLNKGNKAWSTSFSDDYIDSSLNALSLFEFENSDKHAIMNTYGKDVIPSDLSISLSRVNVNLDLSGGNCSSSILDDIKQKISIDKRISVLKDKAENLSNTNKKNLLQKKSIYSQLAELDKENNYSSELDNVEKQMRTLAKKELENEGKSIDSKEDTGLTVETKKEDSKEKDDFEKIKKEEKKKQTEISKITSANINYEKHVSELKQLRLNGQKSTQQYKTLLSLVENHEVARNIPIEQRQGYNMSGIKLRSLAGTSTSSKDRSNGYNISQETNENIARVKANSNKIGEGISEIAGGIVSIIQEKNRKKELENKRKEKEYQNAVSKRNEEVKKIIKKQSLITNEKMTSLTSAEFANWSSYMLSSNINNLKKLRHLNLRNYKSRSLPKNIAELKNLETISIDLYFTGDLTSDVLNGGAFKLNSEIKELKKLRDISFIGNGYLTEIIVEPSVIEELESLEGFTIYSNNLHSLPKGLLNSKTVEKIRLSFHPKKRKSKHNKQLKADLKYIKKKTCIIVIFADSTKSIFGNKCD